MVCSKTLCFPHVSLPRPEIQFKILAKEKENEESSYIDNPYLPGGKRENFNLYTGIKKTNTQNRTNNNGTHNTKSKGAGQQNYKQGRNQWEPYPNDQETNNQEEDSYQGRNGGEGLGTQYRD
jgi:hypothetical protein